MFKHNSRDACRNETNTFAATRCLKHARLTWSAERCQCLPPVTLLQRNGLYFILPINRDVPHWRWLEIPNLRWLLKKLRLLRRRLLGGSCSGFLLWNFRLDAAEMLIISCRSWQGWTGTKHSTLTFCPRPARHHQRADTLWPQRVEANTKHTSPSDCIYWTVSVHVLGERSTRQITSTTRPKHDMIS